MRRESALAGAFAGDGNRSGTSLVFRTTPAPDNPGGETPPGWEDRFYPLPEKIGARPATVRDAEWTHYHMGLLFSESLGRFNHIADAQSEWHGVIGLLDAPPRDEDGPGRVVKSVETLMLASGCQPSGAEIRDARTISATTPVSVSSSS